MLSYKMSDQKVPNTSSPLKAFSLQLRNCDKEIALKGNTIHLEKKKKKHLRSCDSCKLQSLLFVQVCTDIISISNVINNATALKDNRHGDFISSLSISTSTYGSYGNTNVLCHVRHVYYMSDFTE